MVRSILVLGFTSSFTWVSETINSSFFDLPIDHFIAGTFIKGIIKSETLVLQILGKVNLGLGFMDDNIVFVGHRNDIAILLV